MSNQDAQLADVANAGIEHARYCTEQARWLDALATSIRDTLEGGTASLEVRISRAKDLAGLASYLAYDLSNYSVTRTSDLQGELDATLAGMEGEA